MDLKINESKLLEFNAIIEGKDDIDNISSKLRIDTGEIEFGFPASIEGKKIHVKIPSLNNYIKENKFRNLKDVTVRLDIITKDKLFTPWSDNLNIEVPIEIKAEMTGMKEFIEEANNLIKISRIKEEDIDKLEINDKNDVKQNKKHMDKIIEKNKKAKSKFSVMLEEKCL